MTSSTLDPDALPSSDRQLNKGHDNHALGPGDSSDSGSDITGIADVADSDSQGTGERATVEHGGQGRVPEIPSAVEQITDDDHVGEDIVDDDAQQLKNQTDSVHEAKKIKRDKDLDAALEHTFPASDPINLTPEPPQNMPKNPVR